LLEAIDANTCTLHTGAHSFEALSSYLTLIGVDFEVHEPPELLVALNQLAERLQRAAR
jgi:hypothetical protein